MRQLALYDDGTTPLALGPSLTEQAARWPIEAQVLIDDLTERGWRFEALDDLEVEARRLDAVNRSALWMTREVRSRGTRRSWYQPARPGQTGWFTLDGKPWAFIAYEPRLEREIGATGRRTDHERSKLTHWKGAVL